MWAAKIVCELYSSMSFEFKIAPERLISTDVERILSRPHPLHPWHSSSKYHSGIQHAHDISARTTFTNGIWQQRMSGFNFCTAGPHTFHVQMHKTCNISLERGRIQAKCYFWSKVVQELNLFSLCKNCPGNLFNLCAGQFLHNSVNFKSWLECAQNVRVINQNNAK